MVGERGGWLHVAYNGPEKGKILQGGPLPVISGVIGPL